MSGKSQGGPLSRKQKAELASAKARAAKRHVNDASDNGDEDEEDATNVVNAEVVQDGDSDHEDGQEEENEVKNADQPEQMILTKTKYRLTRVRGESATTVFRAVKFLNTPQLMEKTLDKLCTKFNVSPELKISWKLLYQKEMVYVLNNKRNSVTRRRDKTERGS
jgi:hypothetical protein